MRTAPDPHRWPAGTGAALAVSTVLLLLAGRYGLHGDELYFRMLPLRWWYDDQPPLTVWFSRLAATLSDAAWVQRVPAALAAGVGALVAAAFPRALGHGRQPQAAAAWAHAGTTYPLIMGHVFLTSTLDLLAWQLVVLLVVQAVGGRPHRLAWAGVVTGLACWNKLLVLPLAGALVVGLMLTHRRLLLSRHGLVGALAAALLGGPQVLAQALHGWPMSGVSADLIARNGDVNRWLVLPLLVAFVGPPFVGVVVHGLRWASPDGNWFGPVAPALVVLVGWNVLFPAQPYYAVALGLCALALGWGPAADDAGAVWRRRWAVVAANTAVAAVLALPLLPAGWGAFAVSSAINPVARAQVGWRDHVDQVDRARGGDDVAIVADSYALAGAIHQLRGSRMAVASGHNALWHMGPPRTEEVLLVGERGAALTTRFQHCEAAGRLRPDTSDPFGVAGQPMTSCRGPIGGWDAVWPAFRHLGA